MTPRQDNLYDTIQDNLYDKTTKSNLRHLGRHTEEVFKGQRSEERKSNDSRIRAFDSHKIRAVVNHTMLVAHLRAKTWTIAWFDDSVIRVKTNCNIMNSWNEQLQLKFVKRTTNYSTALQKGCAFCVFKLEQVILATLKKVAPLVS